MTSCKTELKLNQPATQVPNELVRFSFSLRVAEPNPMAQVSNIRTTANSSYDADKFSAITTPTTEATAKRSLAFASQPTAAAAGASCESSSR